MPQKLVCAKEGCFEDMTQMSFNDIIMHDIEKHGDDFLRSCLTKEEPDQDLRMAIWELRGELSRNIQAIGRRVASVRFTEKDVPDLTTALRDSIKTLNTLKLLMQEDHS